MATEVKFVMRADWGLVDAHRQDKTTTRAMRPLIAKTIPGASVIDHLAELFLPH